MVSKSIFVVVLGWLVGCGAGVACPRLASESMAAASQVSLAPPAENQRGMQVEVLLDEPVLKILSITLRGGTPLPEHTVPAPVLIQAVQGSGVVIADGRSIPVTPLGGVLLSPNTPHTVRPDEDTTLVLQVQQHLGSSP